MWIQSVRNNLPETDAKAGNAMDRTMEGGALLRQRGDEQVGLADAQAAKYSPGMDSALNLQGDVANTQAGRSNQVWDTYTKSFVPVQQQVAADAMNFDSPEQLERAAQTAGADVTKSFDQQNDINTRNATRMGINPASPAYARGTSNLGLEAAAARAGAETNARDTRRLQAIQLRQGAATTGQALATNANSSDQLALAGAQGAVTGANTALQAPLTARASAVPFYTGSTTSFNDAGSLANANRDTSIKSMQELSGDIMNMGGSMMGAISSKDAKKDKKPVSGSQVLDGLEEVPVEEWSYKKGVADEGRHVGPYAEDVNEQFGDRVAPGGKMIDQMSLLGLTLAAVKELAKKVKTMEGGKGVERSTEPRAKAAPSDTPRTSGVMEKTFGLTPIEMPAEGAY